MSRNTSGSEDVAGSSAREWKRLFGQMQSSTRTGARGGGGGGDVSHVGAGRRGRGGASRGGGGSRGGGLQRNHNQRQAAPSDSPSTSTLLLPLIPTSPSDPLSRIRHKILTTPLPPDTFLSPTGTTYRSIVWKLLLDISSLDIASYLSLVAKGKSPSHEKIRNDTFRTLATDQGFKERVKEEKLIRLLDAFVWKYNRADDADEQEEGEASGVYEFSYVQGMNVLAAPFLYTCHSEVEAFRCFSRFIEYCCPLYVQPTLAGVHRGLQLLDRCLEILDPPLYTHLRSKNLSAEIYAFPSVMTLCACTPPLPEVLQLWDFLLAFGVHYNVLCIVAQLHIMRTDLLESSSPMKLLRHLPDLDARKIINVTVTLARDVPQDLFEELVKHPYHPDSVVGFS